MFGGEMGELLRSSSEYKDAKVVGGLSTSGI